ncbi:TPA: hypothetical protein ACOEDK_004868, partial [Enterobacter kobei]
KYTMKVYKNSDDHAAYLKARSDGARNGKSFEWAGHRWACEVSSFDDAGDYDLLYRFDDKPYPEDIPVVVAADDMTIRDYMAAKALGLCFAQYLNHAEVEGFQDGWRDGVASDAYQMADAMLRAREAS